MGCREGEELSWCPSGSTCLWHGWICGLVHCPSENPTDPIERVLAFSNGISSWIPLKPQPQFPHWHHTGTYCFYRHTMVLIKEIASLVTQPWRSDFPTPLTPLIIPHRLPAFLESLVPLKKRCSIHAKRSIHNLKHTIRFCGSFSKFKTEFYCISFFQKCPLAPDCILKFTIALTSRL